MGRDYTPKGRSKVGDMRDRRVEVDAIAMATALAYEGDRGCETFDVSQGYHSSQQLAWVRSLVQSGAPDLQVWSFDILSIDPETNDVRFIEVKGRGTAGPVEMIEKEHQTGLALGMDYWLYVVFNCNTQPGLINIQDPMRLPWTREPGNRYRLAADIVRTAGQVIAPGA
jgi:uncharacterized protein DUF3883